MVISAAGRNLVLKVHYFVIPHPTHRDSEWHSLSL